MFLNNKKTLLSVLVVTLAGCNSDTSVNANGEFNLSTKEDVKITVDAKFDTEKMTLVIEPKHGTIITDTISDNFIYQPNLNFNGNDTFTIKLESSEKTEIIKYNVIIEAENDAPQILTPSEITRLYHKTGEVWTYQLKFSDSEDSTIATTEEINSSETANKMIVDFVANTLVLDEDNSTENLISYGEFTYNKDTQILTHTTTKEKSDYTETFTVKVTDSNGVEIEKIISVFVDYVNNAPEYNGETSFSINENGFLSIPINGYVNDVDNDNWNISLDTSESVGFFVLNNGNIEYLPQDTYYGEDTVSFTIEDESGDKNTYKLNVLVNRVIDELQVSDLNVSLDEDTTYETTLSYIDTEGVDSSTIKFKVKTNPSHGNIQLNTTNGVFKYVPVSNYNGSDTVVVSVYDELNREEDITINLTINAVSDPIKVVTPVNFSTYGNIHFSGNIASYVKSVDGLSVSFIPNVYDLNGSTLDVKSNGDFIFIPKENERNESLIFNVEMTDSSQTDYLKFNVIIEDKLIKIVDLNSQESESLGTSLYPFNNIDDLFISLQENDEVYFCSNTITLNNAEELYDGVNFTGYDKDKKHSYVKYCENPNAESKTEIVFNDDIYLTINNNNKISGFKFNNLSTYDIIRNKFDELGGLLVSNFEISDVDVNQLEPTTNFINISNVNNIDINNVYVFNGENAFILSNIIGDINIKNVSTDNILHPIIINDIENNSVLTISNVEMTNFDEGIAITNLNNLSGFTGNISDLNLVSVNNESVGIRLNMENENESNMNIENSIIDSNVSLDIYKKMTNSILTIKNNNLKSKGYEQIFTNLIGNNNVLNINENTFTQQDNLNTDEIASYMNILLNDNESTSEYSINIKNNIFNNDYKYNLNNQPSILVKTNANLDRVDLILNVEGNTSNDEDNDMLKIDTSSNNESVGLDLNMSNNDFSNTLYNSLSIDEKNIVYGCLDIFNNKLSNVELVNEDSSSSIGIYDPNNEQVMALYNRQLTIGNYQPISGYYYTFNSCQK